MAVRHFKIDGHLDVSVYKRKGARHIRISVAANNKVRVSIPFWVTYQTGLKFVETKKSWILSQIKPKELLKHGQLIGKDHRLEFIRQGSEIKTRVFPAVVKVVYPEGLEVGDVDVQRLAESACNRALKSEAAKQLPPRLKELAEEHGFRYRDVSVKKMKSRWGSCDSHKNIVLNIYLMQLPWDVIDYVLLHELTHTKLMKHGPEFWALMEEVLPDVHARRKAIKGHKPHLQPGVRDWG